MESAARETSSRDTEPETVRAEPWRLLASLLGSPPDAAMLERLAAIRGDGSEFGGALDALAAAARETDAEALRREFHDLFIGLGRGELIPFASYYRTGFLNERPLADLRGDLARLGVERASGNAEPEDHIASLCEVMAGLIDGTFGPDGPVGLEGQRAFFERHLEPWAEQFFKHLEQAQSAVFYRPVGRLGRIFTTIEQAAFAMLGDEPVRATPSAGDSMMTGVGATG